MDLNPSSQNTRELITNSGKYGLTTGSHAANQLSLTDTGRKVVEDGTSLAEKRLAAFKLCIEEIDPLNQLYVAFSGKPMPSLEVMQDRLETLDEGDRRPCVDIFVGNAKYLDLLRTIGGVKHLLKIEDAHENLAISPEDDDLDATPPNDQGDKNVAPSATKLDYEKTCFFIAPIGDLPSATSHRTIRRRSNNVGTQIPF